MNVLIISSSQQVKSNSVKVGEAMARHSVQFDQADHVDLSKLALPFYSPDIEDISAICAGWREVNEKVKKADAYVMITPEWNGTASPMLKNFLYFLDGQNTSNKPVLLVSISSGISGVYPIAELKANAFKNCKIIPIADHLVIREVDEFLKDEKKGKSDHSLVTRMDYSLDMLHQFAQALKPVREFALNHEQSFNYGM